MQFRIPFALRPLLAAACVLTIAATAARAEPGDWRGSIYFQESALDPSLTTRSDWEEVWLWSNTGMRPGFEVRYRNYGVSWSPPLFGSIQDDPNQIPSRYQDYKLFYYGSTWGVEGYYQKFRGFHSDPPTGASQIVHRGMTADAAIANVYYAFLHKSFPEGEVRAMRDGLAETGYRITPLLMLSASRHALKSDQPFLGTISGAERSAFGSMYQAITHSAIASGVLVCNLNWAGLYFDPGLGFGAGYQHNTYGDGRGGPNVGFKTLILLRTGYMTRWFDFGAMVQNDRTAVDVNPDEILGYESFLGRLYLEVFF
jgi:hypothetical protein